ncbi:MAG: patatin-like phospholipase family protein [Desulfarculus sp.]|nr:MAG: patatin-like phospholipase family protein [Desulfarculus sp.]
MPRPEYRSVVFAGGGNRCTWQAGFWEVVAPALPLRPRVVAGVSAGAAIACCALAGRSRQALAHYDRELLKNPRNFYWGRLLKGRRPFPHLAIYRHALLTLLDAPALARLRAGPEVRVLLARPPAWSGALGGVALGFLAYTLEKHLRSPLHPELPARLGFRPQVVPLSDCATPEEAAELILASSCTPPVLPVMRRGGGPVLDGGLIDNVPLAALGPGDGPSLILLTRRYRPEQLSGHPGRTYVQPSRPVPAAKWDYTDPAALHAAFALGLADGQRFLEGGPAALQA